MQLPATNQRRLLTPASQVIKGFDQAVTGLEVLGTRTLRVQPSDAYGERNGELLIKVRDTERWHALRYVNYLSQFSFAYKAAKVDRCAR